MDPLRITDTLFDECIKIIKKIDIILLSLNHESKITTRDEMLEDIRDIRLSVEAMENILAIENFRPRKRKA